MIVETDHMSVKARSEALTVLERLGYSGRHHQPQLG